RARTVRPCPRLGRPYGRPPPSLRPAPDFFPGDRRPLASAPRQADNQETQRQRPPADRPPMDQPSDSETSPTLLGRLRLDPSDQASWKTFVQRYGPKIYGWCRGWNLQDADAQDVTQNVLLKLAAKLSTFHYDPAGSFRGWLKTLTHHA